MVSHRIEQHKRFRKVVKSCEHIRDTEDSQVSCTHIAQPCHAFCTVGLSDDLMVGQYMRDIEAITSQLTIIGLVTPS